MVITETAFVWLANYHRPKFHDHHSSTSLSFFPWPHQQFSGLHHGAGLRNQNVSDLLSLPHSPVFSPLCLLSPSSPSSPQCPLFASPPLLSPFSPSLPYERRLWFGLRREYVHSCNGQGLNGIYALLSGVWRNIGSCVWLCIWEYVCFCLCVYLCACVGLLSMWWSDGRMEGGIERKSESLEAALPEAECCCLFSLSVWTLMLNLKVSI